MKERVLAAVVASVFFIIACATPAMRVATVGYQGTPGHEKDMSGFELLLNGWMGAWSMNFGWYANPLFAIALLLLLVGADRKALWVGTFAALVGLSSLTWFVQPLPSGSTSLAKLVYPSMGFVCWMLSLSSVPLTALELSSRHKASAT
ncbi:hypothetical protein D7V93_36145 [Corallococcus llansteffanensis]|uniref:Uncharacterized protein n=1 Tax=Corallococcus llansteffanensis TaxID=2316731 RepID=A0A3A8NLY0_9BACT|nr:hypothetical protein D7V93_36145 [Corallococcus llansteffanensis]